jgi:hypothetical protein
MKKHAKLIKFITGLLLLPTAFFALLSFAEIFWALVKGYKVTLYFLAGAAIYFFLHKFVYDFSRVYVAGHECAHALAAVLCGHKVESIEVKENSGNTKVSGVNPLILLAPYILPFGSFCTVFSYFILNLLIKDLDKRVFVAMFGFFTALHAAHTYKALTETEQSDIKLAGGSVFSFSLIVLLNVVITAALLELFFPGLIPVWQITKDIAGNTWVFWKGAVKYSYNFIIWLGAR